MVNTTSGRCGSATRLRALGLCVSVLAILNLLPPAATAGNGAMDRITGTVTVEHIGNHPDGEPGTALVQFEAFAATAKHAARGSLQLDIANSTGEVGRRITVQVTDAWMAGDEGALIGVVTADIRSSDPGGHHANETDESGHDSGHETPGTEPGHDSGDSDHGGPADHATGKDRVGQLMAVKVTDGGSPGRADMIDWKWFVAGTVTLEDVIDMDGLCDKGPKIILGGNIVVHLASAGPSVRPSPSIG